MEPKTTKSIIIPKEKAVFRMDANGTWWNEHGKFEHPGIIRHFNTSIRKDEKGYHVYQSNLGTEEKVYFPYEDTAIFAVDLQEGPPLELILNTGDSVHLDPHQLTIKQDNLYMQTTDHCIKFSTRAMMKLSRCLEEKDGKLFLTIRDKSYPIG